MSDFAPSDTNTSSSFMPSGGRLIMHQVVALIAERQKGTFTNRPLSQLLSVMCLMSKA
ncbi:hypothetical protein Hanom_Chr09g00793151 [Helianthus anomalus]